MTAYNNYYHQRSRLAYEYDPDIDIYADQDEDEAEGLEDYFERGIDD